MMVKYLSILCQYYEHKGTCVLVVKNTSAILKYFKVYLN